MPTEAPRRARQPVFAQSPARRRTPDREPSPRSRSEPDRDERDAYAAAIAADAAAWARAR